MQAKFEDFPTIKELEKDNPSITTELLTQLQLKRFSALESLLWDTLKKTRDAYLACGLTSSEVEKITLALIRRHCGREGSPICKNNVPAFSGSPGETRYAVLLDWIDARISPYANVNLSKITTDYNRPILLTFNEKNSVNLNDVLANSIKENGITEWPVGPNVFQQIANAEIGIQKIRLEKNVRLTGTLPRALGLSARSTVAILDAVGNPQEAFDRVERRAIELKQNIVKNVSDEIARTRMNECYRFLGKRDLTELAQCSGYEVNSQTLIKCLSQAECVPTISANSVRRDVAIFAEALTSKQLAASSLLGRLPVKYDQLSVAFNQCKDIGGDKEKQALCLNKAVLPEKATEFEQCARLAKNNTERLNCASKATGVQVPEAIRKCVGSTSNQSQCLLNATFPQIDNGLAAVSSCTDFSQSKSQLKTCLSKLPIGGDAAILAQCVTANDKDQTAKLVLCLGGKTLPDDAKKAIACFANGDGKLASTAACLAQDAIPGIPKEVSKVIACAAESQGDPLGTTICAASDALNAELRIALQCAVSSGGEPSATSACTLGRLTLKELNQCAGKKFFDEGCFGKGNEIQKMAKLLFGSEIGPDSVVGQVANFQLTAIRDAVKFYEASFKEGGKLLQNINSEASVAGKAVEKYVDSVGKDIEKNIQDFGKGVEQGIQNLGKGILPNLPNLPNLPPLSNILPNISCCRF